MDCYLKLVMKAVILCCVYLIAVAEDTQPCNGKYRTFDGSCNNKNHVTWGSANTAQRRFMIGNETMLAYEDGESIPRGGILSSTLPNPRAVSNAVGDESKGPKAKDQKDPERSAQSFAQGQIIAHDVIATTVNEGIDCCDENNPESSDPEVCFTFTTPGKKQRCMNFVRASRAPDLPDSTHREQINQISSYLDASFLYGSSITRANIVREEDSFLMKVSGNNSLPVDPTRFADHCVKAEPTTRCPFAGDNRVSETPNLQLNHLIWIKEHNRIATALHKLNPSWTNEDVFQETRRIIIAMWQHIVYNEYLPNVLEDSVMKKYALESKSTAFDDPYDPDVDPSIRNVFGVAAWRFGHSQVVGQQSLLASDCSRLTVNKIEDHFFNPHILQVNGGANIEDFTRWLTYTQSMKIDSFVVDGLRKKLFNNSEPAGDLLARNIQRGRDHGVPGYNAWRTFCGLDKIEKFSKKQFGKFGKRLNTLYNDPDELDLIVGGLLETNSGGFVGETFGCIIAQQFKLLKTGDRFWYERKDANIGFTKKQLITIKKDTLLSKIFCRHSNLEEIQKDIFKPGNDNNRVKCKSLPEIKLKRWKE